MQNRTKAAKEAHLRSITKAFSWRFVGSLDTFLLGYLLTGNGKWAVSIASAEVITKIVLYYVHERVWRRARWGRDGEAHSRSLLKGVSWRAIGTLDTFLLSWLITGHMQVAGAIASVEVVTKIGLYYVHERAWKLIPFGREALAAREAAEAAEARAQPATA